MFDGYVLVGGKSSRMGTDKFALSLGDMTFAERASSALRKIADGRGFVRVNVRNFWNIERQKPVCFFRLICADDVINAPVGNFTQCGYSAFGKSFRAQTKREFVCSHPARLAAD